jgi:hypothetical protein
MPTSWDGCADITTALDDLLVGRLCACTVCGRPDRRQGIWPVVLGGRTVGTAYAMCARCGQDQTGFHRQLRLLLAARYEKESG